MTVTTTTVTTGILYHCHHPHFPRADILPTCPTFDVNGGTAGQDHNIGSGADRPWRFRCHGCHAGRWRRHTGLIGHCSTYKMFLVKLHSPSHLFINSVKVWRQRYKGKFQIDGAVCVCAFSVCVCVCVFVRVLCMFVWVCVWERWREGGSEGDWGMDGVWRVSRRATKGESWKMLDYYWSLM